MRLQPVEDGALRFAWLQVYASLSRPAVEGRVPFLDRHEQSFPGGAHLTFCFKGHRDPGFPTFEPCRMGANDEFGACRGWPSQANVVGRRDGARRLVRSVAVHHRDGRSPVPVAIEQGSDDASVDHAGKGLVVRFWLKPGHKPFLYAMGVDA